MWKTGVAGVFALAAGMPAAAVTDPRAEQFTVVGAAAPAEPVQFDIYLPLSHEAKLEQLLADQVDPVSARYHQWLTPAEFATRFGPTAAAVAQARKIAARVGLTVTGTWSQGITVAGSVAQVNALFGVRLHRLTGDHGDTRLAALAGLHMPAGLTAIGATIAAFGTVIPHHKHSVVVETNVNPSARTGHDRPVYYFDDLKQAYDYPAFNAPVRTGKAGQKVLAPLIGTGVGIGVLMSSTALQSDIDAYFNAENFTTAQSGTAVPIPTLTVVEVDGGSGAFGNSTAEESSLDVQQAMGSAPGARVYLYDTPDLNDDSLLDGFKRMIEDNLVDVVSASLGACELYYTAPYTGGIDMTGTLRQYNKLFKQGNAQGITFVASSGDDGALDCTPLTQSTENVPGVENPADLPTATGVGGTNLTTNSTYDASGTITLDATYDYELAYADRYLPNAFDTVFGSGGGLSVLFPKPAFQTLVTTDSTTARAVPDIAMHMGGCPANSMTCNGGTSAVFTAYDGTFELLIGTSAATPEFAGVVALLVQKTGTRQGNINPYIYGLAAKQQAAGGRLAPAASQVFHRLIPGNNGLYGSLAQVHSNVAGVGTPHVAAFLGLPANTPLAGTPQTASNP